MITNLDTVSRFDTSKTKLDVLEAWDVVDDLKRYVDKLQRMVNDIEADKQGLILLNEIKDKKIRELTQKVVTLETKLKMYERGSNCEAI